MIRFFLLFLITVIGSCTAPPVKEPIKEKPQFTSKIEDPEVQAIVDEFFRLSARNNLEFNQKVTIGFSKIKKDSVIGTCTYADGWREIDLDADFWARATWKEKVALVYHELSHCYCERDHDYDNGIMYPDNSLKAILQDYFAEKLFTPMKPKGFFDDECPVSIMHPVIVNDQCFETHYQHYTQEMFARCKPW